MHIEIHTNKKASSFLNKLTLVIFGTFLASLLFSIAMKLFNEYGIWIGLMLSIAISYLGFKKSKAKSKSRLILWGFIGTITFITLIFLISLSLLDSALQDL